MVVNYTPQYFQRFYGFLRTHGELTIEQRKAAQQAIRTHGIIRLAERHLPGHPKVRRAIHDFMMLGKLSAMVIRDLDTLMKPIGLNRLLQVVGVFRFKRLV
jgi:hypothetical protein